MVDCTGARDRHAQAAVRAFDGPPGVPPEPLSYLAVDPDVTTDGIVGADAGAEEGVKYTLVVPG